MTSVASKSPSDGLPDGLPTPRRYWAAGTVLVGIGLSVLDTTIANVALPTIAADLNVHQSKTLWIINAYNLAVVMLLLPLSVVAGIGLLRRSLAQPAPLVPVDLLRIRPLVFAVLASACSFAAQMAAYVTLPFYFEHNFGRLVQDVGIFLDGALGGPTIRPLFSRYA